MKQKGCSMLPVSFFMQNRQELAAMLPPKSLAVVRAGSPVIRSSDEYYPFSSHRNFYYLTGSNEQDQLVFVYSTDCCAEPVLFLRRPDAMQERWTGKRLHEDEACRVLGFKKVAYADQAEDFIAEAVACGLTVWTDGEKDSGIEHNLRPFFETLRTVKKPCEIEAMRKAAVITGEGIKAMMRVCRPGMKEYQLKAEFDHALAVRGVLTPGFPSIICCGKNNFIIHYYDYTGDVNDGDMVLNDVGACWDGEINDVSRAWPVNGKFSERQRALYQCIYNTSEYLFSIIKPGIPVRSVDENARLFCFEELKKLGLIDDFKDIRKIMWHDGAHHVGLDVHDVIDRSMLTTPGMVFCVDIGVYAEDWGIGFRLEDNCLVTENGCENLTAAIPRSIEEIEAFMARR